MIDKTPDDDHETQPPASHWYVLRDVVVFQLKLAMDGVRDILLSPLSIIAAVVGLVSRPDNPGVHFYRVLRLGHRTEKWINLFGDEAHGDASSDFYLQKVEDLIVNEYNKGGMVKSVKDNADDLIDRLRNRKEDG